MWKRPRSPLWYLQLLTSEIKYFEIIWNFGLNTSRFLVVLTTLYCTEGIASVLLKSAGKTVAKVFKIFLVFWQVFIHEKFYKGNRKRYTSFWIIHHFSSHKHVLRIREILSELFITSQMILHSIRLQVMFSVMFVCMSTGGGVFRVTTADLCKLVHLGTNRNIWGPL